MKKIEFKTYLKEIRPLIIRLLNKQLKNKKKRQKDMLLDCFTDKEQNIYHQVHLASMKNGYIWEIVFFKFPGWEKIGIMNGKSNTRNIIIELKNKSTTFNSASKKGTIIDIRKF